MVECFSRIESARCQGLSDTQNIIVFLPSGLSLLLVPVLLALVWKTPRSTVILLAIALLLNGTVDTWNLVTQLVPPTPETFRSQDVALGAISSLPSVFFLLFVTSFLVSDLRTTLPAGLQSTPATLLFASIFLPLVPASFVATLLGNVLFIGYFAVGQSIELGFERTSLRNAHDTLTVVGIATATGFVAVAFLLTMLVLLNSSCRSRWIEDFRSVPALVLIAVGLLLASLDLVVAIARESLAAILARRILETTSRVLLTIGLVGSYYPLPLVERAGSGGAQTSPKADTRQSRSKAGKPQRPSRPSIGQPVTGSFHRMSHAATRSLHTAHRDQRQKEEDEWNKEDVGHHERVVMRNRPQRAPKLSFTPSTFDQADLASLADGVRDRERLIQQSIAMNEQATGGDNPFLSPEEQRERYLQVKQSVSSTYRPSLGPVEEREASPSRPTGSKPLVGSDWPMPPDFTPPVGLVPWHTAVQRNSVASRGSRNYRVGQVSAYKTGDQLHPTPSRSNSAKRKPVPEYELEPEKSIAGDLSFISLSSAAEDEHARGSSPTMPSPESNEAGPSSRPGRRRDTDPANAVVIPRSPNESSMYSQSTDHADDQTLFFRAPLRSPSSSTPGKSTTQSPRVSVVPPSRTSRSDGWDEERPDMAMALSSLARVRRDTGVDLPNQLQTRPEGQERLSTGSNSLTLDREALERSSTITWTNDDLTPRASERGWWSAGLQDT